MRNLLKGLLIFSGLMVFFIVGGNLVNAEGPNDPAPTITLTLMEKKCYLIIVMAKLLGNPIG